MGALELHMYGPSYSEQRMPRGLSFVRRASLTRVSDRNLSQYCMDSLPLNDSISK